MRKLCFAFLCITLGLGMMAGPAAADVIGVGSNEIHFFNYEILFKPVVENGVVVGYQEYDFEPGVPVPVQDMPAPGDIYVGIISVQDVQTNGVLNWTFSTNDQLTGIFAQEISEVILPDNGDETPGVKNEYDVANDWDDKGRVIFEPANTGALVFTTLGADDTAGTPDDETFTLGSYLSGDEMMALYRDINGTTMETNGTIVDDIGTAVDGNLWATFGYDIGIDDVGGIPMSSPEAAGDSDDTGYYYAYAPLAGLPPSSPDFVVNAWAGLDFIQNNTGLLGAGNMNDINEGEMEAIIANLFTDMYLSAYIDAYDNWALGISPWVFASNDPAYLGAEIPEPATMLLLGTGMIGLAGFARRRRKKNLG